MQPESSDGLASVGTILPGEVAAFCRAAISISALWIWSKAKHGCPALPDTASAVNSMLD
jgi:hypothetical protein